jgi:hypothetical protein
VAQDFDHTGITNKEGAPVLTWLLALLAGAIVYIIWGFALTQLKPCFYVPIVPPDLVTIFDRVRMPEEVFVVCSSKNEHVREVGSGGMFPLDFMGIIGVDLLNPGASPANAGRKLF